MKIRFEPTNPSKYILLKVFYKHLDLHFNKVTLYCFFLCQCIKVMKISIQSNCDYEVVDNIYNKSNYEPKSM